MKINNYLHKKKDLIVELKNKKLKKDYKKLLDVQVAEKQQRMQEQREEDHTFHDTLVNQLREEDRRKSNYD